MKHAQEAGASAAIVYDDVYEALIIMSKPRDHAEPGIPSVFVAQKTGIVMKKLMSPPLSASHLYVCSQHPLPRHLSCCHLRRAAPAISTGDIWLTMVGVGLYFLR